MPNRIIKESICTSDSIDNLTWFEEVLFYRLIVSCDDFGRYDGRAAVIKNRLFPLKEDKLKLKEVTNAINHLSKAGLIQLYTCNGKQFLYLPTWESHQSIRAQKSKYPDPSDGCELLNTSESNCLQMNSDVPVIQSYSESYSYSDAKSEKPKNRKRFTPPTLEEVKAYVQEKGYSVDAEYFFKYYAEGDWIDSKGNQVKNWKQKLITWAKKDGVEQQQPQKKKQFTTAENYTPPHSTIDVANLERIKREFGLDGNEV